MGTQRRGFFAGPTQLLRRWFGGRPADVAPVDPAATLAPRFAVPPAAHVDHGADDPPDVRLRAALTDASRALWLGAMHAPATASGRGTMQPLRAAVLAVLDGELAERHFPRRPLLMPQLMAAVRDPAAAATRLADIIAQDPVLAGNVLRLANSAWYRVTQDPVETLQRAVIVCGTDGLQSLAALALMQPVFRGESGAFGRLPQLLWDRTTRATLAADLYARRVCPGERHSAQLLVLLRALGPLVVFRIIDEHYRGYPQMPRDAGGCAELLVQLGGHAAARIAAQWDSSERICGVLSELNASDRTRVPDEVQMDLAAAVAAGELLGTISVLVGTRVWDSAAGLEVAAEAGMPRDWMLATLTRLGRQA